MYWIPCKSEYQIKQSIYELILPRIKFNLSPTSKVQSSTFEKLCRRTHTHTSDTKSVKLNPFPVKAKGGAWKARKSRVFREQSNLRRTANNKAFAASRPLLVYRGQTRTGEAFTLLRMADLQRNRDGGRKSHVADPAKTIESGDALGPVARDGKNRKNVTGFSRFFRFYSIYLYIFLLDSVRTCIISGWFCFLCTFFVYIKDFHAIFNKKNNIFAYRETIVKYIYAQQAILCWINKISNDNASYYSTILRDVDKSVGRATTIAMPDNKIISTIVTQPHTIYTTNCNVPPAYTC